MSKNSKCPCVKSPNCNNNADPCGDRCADVQNIVPIIVRLLSGTYTSQLVQRIGNKKLQNESLDDYPSDAAVYEYEAITPADLTTLTDGAYYIIPNPAPTTTGNNESGVTLTVGEFDAAVALPANYDVSVFAKIIGSPLNQSLDHFIALVGYITDRISCLDLSCCVKDKVVDEINAYVDKLLGFTCDGKDDFAAKLSSGNFTGFCADETTVIPLTGPIYVSNNVVTGDNYDAGVTGAPDCENINYVMEFLQYTQLKLRIAYSGRCCCDGRHVKCCSKTSYDDICSFVFGRICVIEWPDLVCNENDCSNNAQVGGIGAN